MARILLADDDTSSLDVMTVALTAEGHEVLCASNGQDAVETALVEQPDLVFLDVMMPVMDGYEACEQLRNDPDIPESLPIIFLTSIEPDVKMLEKVGATGHLPKRHMVAELRDLLAEHLGPEARGAGQE